MITQITSYAKESFTSTLRNGKTVTHDIYTQGSGSKVLILIQELPGIGQETLALADQFVAQGYTCLLYTSPSPRDGLLSRMPSYA